MAARRDRSVKKVVGADPAARLEETPKSKPHRRASIKEEPIRDSRRTGSRFEGTVTDSTPQHSKHQQYLHSMTQKLRAARPRGG